MDLLEFAIVFVAGWFSGLFTDALTAFAIGVAVGCILPVLWRKFIRPSVSNLAKPLSSDHSGQEPTNKE